MHTHISVAFLYSNVRLSRKEIKKTFSFTITSNKINCSAINLAKEGNGLYTENYKTIKNYKTLSHTILQKSTQNALRT